MAVLAMPSQVLMGVFVFVKQITKIQHTPEKNMKLGGEKKKGNKRLLPTRTRRNLGDVDMDNHADLN